MEHVEKSQAGMSVQIREAALGKEVVRCPDDPGGTGDERASPRLVRTVGERVGEGVQELARANVGSREEQQRGQERVVLTPRVGCYLGGVELCLGSEPGVGHSAEVDLHERPKLAVVFVEKSE